MPQHDYISDRGDEVWNILEQRGIKCVILTGVHTNMCVLGRPFGLRQMVRNGKCVVLMRDMTDTMYNPARWPYVSHFTGTDLVISHVERPVCPTITSDQLLGGKPFRSPDDQRRHLVIVMAEDEYETNRTLPEFASRYLGHDFKVSYVYGREDERNDIPALEVEELGVRVHAIFPGPVDTPLIENTRLDGPFGGRVAAPNFAASVLGILDLGAGLSVEAPHILPVRGGWSVSPG